MSLFGGEWLYRFETQRTSLWRESLIRGIMGATWLGVALSVSLTVVVCDVVLWIFYTCLSWGEIWTGCWGSHISPCHLQRWSRASNGSLAWNLGIYSLNKWDIDVVVSFLSRLELGPHTGHTSNMLICGLIWSECFQPNLSTILLKHGFPIVVYSYHMLSGSCHLESHVKNYFPTWPAALEPVLTICHLNKRHYPCVTPDYCLFCASVLEFVGHVFHQCTFSWWVELYCGRVLYMLGYLCLISLLLHI